MFSSQSFFYQDGFGDPLYLTSTLLDPNWGMAFVSYSLSPDDLPAIRERAKGMHSSLIMGTSTK